MEDCVNIVTDMSWLQQISAKFSYLGPWRSVKTLDTWSLTRLELFTLSVAGEFWVSSTPFGFRKVLQNQHQFHHFASSYKGENRPAVSTDMSQTVKKNQGYAGETWMFCSVIKDLHRAWKIKWTKICIVMIYVVKTIKCCLPVITADQYSSMSTQLIGCGTRAHLCCKGFTHCTCQCITWNMNGQQALVVSGKLSDVKQ